MATPWFSETQQLTEIGELPLEDLHKEFNSLPAFDPYPNKTPSQILERRYLVKEIVLNNTSTQTIWPLKELLSNDTVVNYLSRFRYLRASIDVHLLVLSNEYQYGTIMVSTLPYLKPTEIDRWSNDQQRSQSDAHILDVSTQESLHLVLPYVNPALAYDLSQGLDDMRQWRVQISPLALGSVTTASNVGPRIQVFANLRNPEAAGYTPAAQLQSLVGQRERTHSIMSRVAHSAGALTAAAASTVSSLFGVADQVFAQRPAVASTVSAATVANIVSKLSQTKIEKAPDSCKLTLAPDLSDPTLESVSSKLGDPIKSNTAYAPDVRNKYGIHEICKTPTYIQTTEFSNTNPVIIPVNLFAAGTYAAYLGRMFKYARGSTRVSIRFCTSTSVSGRLRISLLPNGGTIPVGSTPEGDLPTWVITVKGSQTWSLEIPYLSDRPWTRVETWAPPSIQIELLDPLIQPFERNVVIYAHMFVACGDDFCMAGLQSFVPGADFQISLAEQIEACERIGLTYPHPYQGGIDDVHQILHRYSSRDGDPANIYPFPLELTSLNFEEMDNFDYVCNLYMFFAGENNVRMTFTNNVPNGKLQLVVGNSKVSPDGNDFKAGNSLSYTDQTVWPMLEFSYPYFNEYEFDSLYYPNTMYPQKVSAPESLSEIFISATPNFKVFTLLPVPDFAFESENAIFQSGTPRLFGQRLYAGISSIGSNALGAISLSTFPTATCQCEIYGYVYRTDGTSDGPIAITLGTSSNPSSALNSITSSIFGGYVGWCDVTNSGKNMVPFHFSRVLSGYTDSAWYLRMFNGTTNTYQVAWTVALYPFKQASLPMSPDSGFCDVLVGNAVLPISASAPLDVDIISASPGVNVGITGTVSTTVSNTPLPISGSVSLSGDVALSQPVRVVGVDDPDVPVWVSSYRSSGV